ncbi:MAG: ECF transporter S component [Defluviitaleaceae bacterium]|nr:ECF transporter S component [Defluviitaleaceae bacterium]
MKTNVRKMVTSALLISIAVILSQVFHFYAPGSGRIFLPLHIPVLIAGLLCGAKYGLIVGILTPLTSHLITQMPPAGSLIQMTLELATYGMISGLVIHFVKTKSQIVNIYIALFIAMITGRVVFGVLNALIFQLGEYSLSIWLASAFITSLPGIIIQVILIPAIIFTLNKLNFLSENI